MGDLFLAVFSQGRERKREEERERERRRGRERGKEGEGKETLMSHPFLVRRPVLSGGSLSGLHLKPNYIPKVPYHNTGGLEFQHINLVGGWRWGERDTIQSIALTL